jgi:hypothetical protein
MIGIYGALGEGEELMGKVHEAPVIQVVAV